MNISSHFRMPLRTIVLAVAVVILTWLVVSRSLAAFLADAAPQAALWLNPRQPEALVNLAERAVNTADTDKLSARAHDAASQQPKGDPDSTLNVSAGATESTRNLIRAFSAFETIGRNQSISRPAAPTNESTVRIWTRKALMNDPLNARALRILGMLAEADSDDTDASNFMHAADRLSLHDSISAYWLMLNSAQASNYQAAIHYADVLLRTDPELASDVVAVLAHVGEDKDGAVLIRKILATDPPWRAQFISLLPNYVTDVRTPLDLLLALPSDPVPLTADDIKPYVNFLIAHQFYSLAYYTWLQFLPREELRHAGFLFNGNFDVVPSGLPFDWTISSGSGVTVDVVPNPDKSGNNALLVDFQYGRVDYHSVTELIMLAPGSYEFSGKYKGELVGPRGLKWRIVCTNGRVVSGGESPMIMGARNKWKDVTFTFTVPAKDCAAQHVQLDLDARMASEQLISGSILFDDLQISRAASPSSTGG